MVRCPLCGGLRTRSARTRHDIRLKITCKDCRKGKVIYREQFYDFWMESFTMDEIREMGRAIDSILG